MTFQILLKCSISTPSKRRLMMSLIIPSCNAKRITPKMNPLQLWHNAPHKYIRGSLVQPQKPPWLWICQVTLSNKRIRWVPNPDTTKTLLGFRLQLKWNLHSFHASKKTKQTISKILDDQPLHSKVNKKVKSKPRDTSRIRSTDGPNTNNPQND